jgi:hypothetical protein
MLKDVLLGLLHIEFGNYNVPENSSMEKVPRESKIQRPDKPLDFILKLLTDDGNGRINSNGKLLAMEPCQS